jgi:hypothetical protein
MVPRLDPSHLLLRGDRIAEADAQARPDIATGVAQNLDIV